MASITTNSVLVKAVDPETGAITTVPGYEWPYATTDDLVALAPTVVPAARAVGGDIYTRVSVRNDQTNVVVHTDTPLAGYGRDNTDKAVTGPAWAWYLLLARLKPGLSDPTTAWLYDAIEAQTGLTLEYTPPAP